ncbi:excisionase family DNA-binding protein [Nocardia fluminea]|uniref:excisionase family DNA-binding protein n=1 Tax=Nocardia fluminea TaxID=134984 RepID=UPI0033F2FCC6
MTTRSRRLISMKEAAAQMGCGYRTVKRYVADGTIPHVRVGSLIRIDPDALPGVDTAPVAQPAAPPVAPTPPPVPSAVRDEWAAYIEQVVSIAPPLTTDQVARISTLLGSAPGAALSHAS